MFACGSIPDQANNIGMIGGGLVEESRAVHTKAEATKRIRDGLDKLKPQLVGYASSLEDDWQGDDLHFRMTMLKQSVTGRIHVMDQQVRVEVDLPWILATIAEKVRSQIEKHGSQILLEEK